MPRKMTDAPKKRVGRPPLPAAERRRRAEITYRKKLKRDKERRAEKKALLEKAEIGKREELTRDELRKAVEAGVVDPDGHAKGRGRPKGRKNIYSYESVKKLEALDFDPIEKLVQVYAMVLQEIYERHPEDHEKYPGEYIVKRGSMAHSTLLAQLKGIAESLTKFGYRAVPEKQIEEELANREPTIIQLSFEPPKPRKEVDIVDVTPVEES